MSRAVIDPNMIKTDYDEGPYRTPDAPAPSDDDEPSIEEGLAHVLAALEPYDADETTRILAAVASLYRLPVFFFTQDEGQPPPESDE